MPSFLLQNKTDYAFKFALSVFGSNPTWGWFSELFKNEVNVLTSRIWAEDIPFAINFAAADTNSNLYSTVTKREVTLTLQSSHNDRLWRSRVIPGDDLSDIYLDSISPLDVPDSVGNPSSGYTIRLYQDNGSGGLGSEIFTTSGAWAWHYKLCALLLDEGHTASDEGWQTPLHAVFYQYTGDMLSDLSFDSTGSSSDNNYEILVAYENLGEGDLINIRDDGLVRLADSTSLDGVMRAEGFVLDVILENEPGKVYFSGVNDKLSNLMPGKTYYLSSDPGKPTLEVSTSTGSCLQEVGVAITENKLAFKNGEPIIRE